MFRTLKPQSPQKISRKKKHLPDDQLTSHLPAPEHPTLQLQSLIGNHAVQKMIQRMPTQQAIINTLGKPKKNFGLIKNSTKYKLVLDCVHRYDTYIMQTTLGGSKTDIQAQMGQVVNLLNTVKTAVTAYDGDKGKKAAYMQNLKPQIQRDLASASAVTMKYLTAPIPQLKPKLFIALSSINHTMPQLYDRDKSGTDRGGTSEVTEYDGNNPGYFKQNKSTLYDPSIGVAPGEGRQEEIGNKMNETVTGLKEEFGIDEGRKKFSGLQNEYNLGVDLVGIDSQNARMAQRDVAMARIDQLLGGGIIARAQIAVQHTDDGQTSEGSLMEKAKGMSGAKMLEKGQFYAPHKGEQKDPENSKQVSLQDPNLMRLLSRIQLIDLLAFQVDRNKGNYFIQTDNSGNVIGMTGIDNDFALGTNDNIEVHNQELMGMSRYVDEELATKIIDLDPELLRVVVSDLLTDAEINAMLSRLRKLQNFLRPIKDQGNLLKPNQWTQAIAQNLLDEKSQRGVSKNYYSELVRGKK